MKAPLKLRQVNQINSHQYAYSRLKDRTPYLCWRCEAQGDKAMIVADERGLVCPLCGEITTSFPYVDKMGTTGPILR